jgi:hypothetical protein
VRRVVSVNHAPRPEIVASVRAHLATEVSWCLHTAAMRRRGSRLEGRAWLAFDRPCCNTPLGARSRRRKGGALPGPGGDLDVVLLETTVTLPEPVTADRPHWCHPPDGHFCE